jgi:hypothetical protein
MRALLKLFSNTLMNLLFLNHNLNVMHAILVLVDKIENFNYVMIPGTFISK